MTLKLARILNAIDMVYVKSETWYKSKGLQEGSVIYYDGNLYWLKEVRVPLKTKVNAKGDLEAPLLVLYIHDNKFTMIKRDGRGLVNLPGTSIFDPQVIL